MERFNGVAAFRVFIVPLQVILDDRVLVLVDCFVDLGANALTVLLHVRLEIIHRSMVQVFHLRTHCLRL